MESKKQLFTTGNNNWRTPKEIYDGLNKEFNFDFDPCPNDPTFDGLNIVWGCSNFINPPYSTKLQNAFIRKGYEESKKNKICIFLIPVRTGSKRWQEIILPYAKEIRFLKRLKFEGAKHNAPFDSAIVIFGEK